MKNTLRSVLIALLLSLTYLFAAGVSYNYLRADCVPTKFNKTCRGNALFQAALWPIAVPASLSADLSEEWFKKGK